MPRCDVAFRFLAASAMITSLMGISYKAKMAKSNLQTLEKLTKMKLAETSCKGFNDLSFDKVSSMRLSYIRLVDPLEYSS